jgi:hypothetical protein
VKVKPEIIARWAADAGFKGANLQIMIAVILAESGGDTTAHNTKGEDSRGLGQINVAPGGNPDLAGMDLFNGPSNLRACKIVHDRQGFKAWTMWKNGTFLLFMPRAGLAISREPSITPAEADLAAGAISGSPAGKKVGEIAGGISDQLATVNKTLLFFSSGRNWARIGEVVLGGVLLVLALSILAKPAIKTTARTISEVKPI